MDSKSILAFSTGFFFTRFDHRVNQTYPNADDDIYNEQLHLKTGENATSIPITWTHKHFMYTKIRQQKQKTFSSQIKDF